MNIKNNTHHDSEILGLYKSNENLNILLKDKIIVLENIEHWEFTPFTEQNIIFQLNYFSVNNMPSYLVEDYPWLLNYSSLNTLNVLEIVSSVGLSGVAVFSEVKHQPLGCLDGIKG